MKKRNKKKVWTVHVDVFLKEGVLDPQGNAVLHATQTLGFAAIKEVRVGRYIQLHCVGKTKEAVYKQVDALCHRLLANPVIEKYTIAIA